MPRDERQPRLKDADERLAQAVMSAGLGAVVSRLDGDHSGPGTCDLGFSAGPGRRGVAEVVSTRHAPSESLLAATVKTGRVRAPSLTRVWGVSVKPGTEVRRLRKRLPAFLGALEAAVVDGVTDLRPGPWRAALQDLGIGMCWSSQPTETVPPSFLLNPVPTFAFVRDIDHVVARTEVFLAADEQGDVAVKLAAADAAERHAVVVVNEHWLDVESEVRNGAALPTRAPAVPELLDGVWIVALWGGPTRAVFWLRTRGWADVRVDEWRPEGWLAGS